MANICIEALEAYPANGTGDGHDRDGIFATPNDKMTIIIEARRRLDTSHVGKKPQVSTCICSTDRVDNGNTKLFANLVLTYLAFWNLQCLSRC